MGDENGKYLGYFWFIFDTQYEGTNFTYCGEIEFNHQPTLEDSDVVITFYHKCVLKGNSKEDMKKVIFKLIDKHVQKTYAVGGEKYKEALHDISL